MYRSQNIPSSGDVLLRLTFPLFQYLRSQRLGLATFIPLDHVQVKPVNEKLRSVAKGVRLAVDLIQYDPSLERAIHHACGSAIVCDSMEVAKQVVYERGIEVKGALRSLALISSLTSTCHRTAVTLEGTVIHKGGNITGGVSGTGAGRRWEEAEVKSPSYRRASPSLP